MQLYPGLVRAIQATGDIKWYQIGQSILLLLPIPLGVISFKCGFVNYSIAHLMVLAQILMLIYTLIIANRKTGLELKLYTIYLVKSVLLFIIVLAIGVVVHFLFVDKCHQLILLFLVSVMTCSIFALVYYFIVFDIHEKVVINEKMISLTKYLKIK